MRKVNNTKFYLVLNAGSVIFKSINQEDADYVAEELMYRNRYKESIFEFLHEVVFVDIARRNKNSEIELDNGDCVLVSSIKNACTVMEDVLLYG